MKYNRIICSFVYFFGELYMCGVSERVHSDCEREIETEIDRISEKDRDRETQKTD